MKLFRCAGGFGGGAADPRKSKSGFLKRRTPRPDEVGASAVEFALIVSVLFMLVMGIVHFGLAYHRQQGLEAAAREGARLASVGGTYDEIVLRTRQSQSLFQAPHVVVVTVPPSLGGISPCSIAGVGGVVGVTATVLPNPAYEIAIPFWGGRQVTYTASGSFRCERGGLL